MFKKIGKIAKGVFRGVRDILPVAQVADSVTELKAKKALDLVNDPDGKTVHQVVNEVADILDDGKKNDSYDEAKTEVIARVITGGVPAVAYIVHGIVTGNWLIF